MVTNKEKFEKIMDGELIRRITSRRQMAWSALISTIVITVLILFIVPTNRLALTETVSTWFFTIMGSIVLAYTGAATWFDIKNIGKNRSTSRTTTISDENTIITDKDFDDKTTEKEQE